MQNTKHDWLIVFGVCAILFLTVLLTGCTAKTIYNDPGGRVSTYAKEVYRLQHNGVKIKLSGYCASACTMYLALPKEQYCLYEGTTLWFHAAYGGSPLGNFQVTMAMFKLYPNWVQYWIMANGGLSNQTLVMPYKYSKQFTNRC